MYILCISYTLYVYGDNCDEAKDEDDIKLNEHNQCTYSCLELFAGECTYENAMEISLFECAVDMTLR